MDEDQTIPLADEPSAKTTLPKEPGNEVDDVEKVDEAEPVAPVETLETTPELPVETEAVPLPTTPSLPQEVETTKEPITKPAETIPEPAPIPAQTLTPPPPIVTPKNPTPAPTPTQVPVPKPSKPFDVSSLTNEQLKQAAALYTKRNQAEISKKGVAKRQLTMELNLREIVDFLSLNNGSPLPRIAKHTNITPGTTSKYLRQLIEKSKVRAEGWGKTRRYYLK